MYRIGKIYIPDGASARRIRAGFNAASMSDDSIRAFAGTDFLNADAALRRSVRLLIAARARNEFANNSFAYGIVTTLANDTIGKGPHLQLVHTDDAEGVASPRQEAKLQRRERRFARWARAVKLTSILRCARIAKAIDGETFLLLSENRGARREITLQPNLVECEKILKQSSAETNSGCAEMTLRLPTTV